MEKDVKLPISTVDAPRVAGSMLGSVADRQSVTEDWQSLQDVIAGVQVKEVKNVIKDNGCITEIWRDDWPLVPAQVGQVFQALLQPGAVSAWHAHRSTVDRLFANHGLVKIVLYDARPESPTEGRVNVFRCGSARPMLIVVPSEVWHGVQNLGAEPALLLNLPDRPYRYEAPDHWRLPADSERIPYSFAQGATPLSFEPGRI